MQTTEDGDTMAEDPKADVPKVDAAKNPKRVLVIGAGITGLTVAHELVERGYAVTVVEKALWKAIDQPALVRLVQSDGETVVYPPAPTCNVGGMARTQWAAVADEQPGPDEWTRARRTLNDDPGVPSIAFAFANGEATPTEEAAATDSMVKIAAYLRGHPRRVIAAEVVAGDNGKMMRAWFEKRLDASLLPRVRWGSFTGTVLSDSTLFFVLPMAWVPGEHGFRFFPAFYRHVFDTMQRTPIPTVTRGVNEFGKTVYDNLVSSDTLRIGLPGGKSFDVNRNPRSIKDLRTIFKEVLSKCGWTVRDIGRLELKMFKYMTSSTKRRAAEYENISWSEFIDAPLYSDTCQKDLEWSPQTLGALRGSASDCRTQGNISIQLMLEQFSEGPRFDSLLNAPTSVAWLQHWRAVLEGWNVKFVLGELTDFVGKKIDGAPVVLPVIKKIDADTGEVTDADVEDLQGLQDSQAFVLALDLPSVRDLSDRFIKAAGETPEQAETKAGDFQKVWRFLSKDYREQLKEAAPNLPLQHLSGVQYYFGLDKVLRLAEGHALYMRAPWGLTSITQSLFWDEEIPGATVVSVDVATWNRGQTSHEGTPYPQAWGSSRKELAKNIWSQISRKLEDQAARSLRVPHRRSFGLQRGKARGEQGPIPR